jgi:metal-dependent amidase/aminoacylase/carboxypeptidase family protein
MLHPSTENVANFSSAAIATCDVTFRGTPAHAAASPWEGENTLDALVLAHSAIGLARQQLRPSDRIHGIVKQGGQAVNIIPEFSSATYNVRSPDPTRVIELQKVLERCCRGCAVATSTAVDIKWTRCFAQDGIFPGYDVHSNQILAQTFQDYMETHGIKFSSGGGLLANASTVMHFSQHFNI